MMMLATTAQTLVVDTMLKKADSKPFSYAVAVADGNYKVTVTLGSKKRVGQTVVRAESRRHYTDLITTKKGKFEEITFVVNLAGLAASLLLKMTSSFPRPT